MASGNNQIIVTTHSPLFVSGEGFENVRLVRKASLNAGTTVRQLGFEDLCSRIRIALGEDPRSRTQGLLAKIHQTLQPGIAEMFFTRVPVLVEGLEDVAYITAELYLSGRWTDFRRLGCQLIPVHGKGKLIQPLAIAVALGVPTFVVFDADGNETSQHRTKHERDNRALISLLSATIEPFPTNHVWGQNHAIWKTNLTDTVRNDFGSDYGRLTEAARQHYAQEGGLEKNGLFIAQWLSLAKEETLSSPTLARLCDSILTFAGCS